MMMNNLLIVYHKLSNQVYNLKFSPPADIVYNPLDYAWDGFAQYMRYSDGQKRVVFLGMNPGPWGMTQTGVPFGEVEAVKNFLGITRINITQPENAHASRPVQGLECKRSEVSGKRLWGLFREKFGTAENFFAGNFVLNYCPLLFSERTEKGSLRNITPDKLVQSERDAVCGLCDEALVQAIEILRPDFVVGVGAFAYNRAKSALERSPVKKRPKITKILHPSPANPQANHGWAAKTESKLISEGVWSE